MTDSIASPEPSSVPSAGDFESMVAHAQATGDYDRVIRFAKASHQMLLDFRQVVNRAKFCGDESEAVAQGLHFLSKMVLQSQAQLEEMNRRAKESRKMVKVGANGNA